MAKIIAGRFQQQDDALRAVERLQAAGFPADRVSTFYVNPAGRHSLTPIGGDQPASPGAKAAGGHAAAGAAIGAAAGVAVGIAAAPLLGPAAIVAATGVAAYVGALQGAVHGLEETKDQSSATADEHSKPESGLRASGMLVAAAVGEAGSEERAIAILNELGVVDLESAEGSIVDGDWIDFDPLRPIERLS